MAVDAVFELMENRPQSECAFKLEEASFGFQQRPVEFPELRGLEAGDPAFEECAFVGAKGGGQECYASPGEPFSS